MSVESKYKELFEKGEHKKALSYLKDNRKDFDPALYHYNLGVNYAKLDQLVEARYQFEMAKNQGLYSKELRSSLQKVRELSGAEQMEEKSTIMDYVYDQGVSSSLYTGINISLIALIIVIVQFKNLAQNWSKFALVLLSLAPMLGQLYLKTNYANSLALAESPVLLGPSKIFEQKQSLTPGMKVIVGRRGRELSTELPTELPNKESKPDEWLFIVSPSSHRGWVQASNLRSL